MAYTKIEVEIHGTVVREEKKAAAAITPGMLLYRSALDTVAKHAVAGGPATPMFAIENRLAGKTVSDDYATSDRVQVVIPRRGDKVAALLYANESVTPGDYLESNGDGTLRKVDADASAGDIKVNSIVAFAEETANPSANTLILVCVV